MEHNSVAHFGCNYFLPKLFWKAIVLFVISFFCFWDINVFELCKWKSDDIIGGPTKIVQHSWSIYNITTNIKAVFFKLGTRTKKKQNDTCRVVAMTTIMLLVLFQFRPKFPHFISGTHNNLMGRVKIIIIMGTMCVRSKTLCPTLKGYKRGYSFFSQRKTGAKSVAMETT